MLPEAIIHTILNLASEVFLFLPVIIQLLNITIYSNYSIDVSSAPSSNVLTITESVLVMINN